MLDEIPPWVDALANEIRRVDGQHELGAGALAGALVPWLQSTFEGWHDAAEEVDYAWHQYATAKDAVTQARAVTSLNNHMSDLRSWLPGYDPKTGTMPWEREEED